MFGEAKVRLHSTLGVSVLLTVVAVCSMSGFAAMTMSPYLQAVTSNSVYVLVECDSMNPVTVEYGPTSAYGSKASTESTEATAASPVTYVHNVKLTGLQPNTRYHYRVSQGGPLTADYTFITAAEPGTGFRFCWMGDCRTNTGPHDEIAKRLLDANPRFLLYGGDLCGDSSYGMFKAQFFRPNELQLIANVPFFLTVGNHESWGTNTKAFTQAPSSASGTQDYYSFDYGDVHFLCLNTEIDIHAGTPQDDFAAKDLANTKKPWKIVLFHKSAYCAGGHGEAPTMVAMTTKTFEPNGVDLVLTAHSHFYQHNLINGLHHLVLGTAGAPIDTPGTASYTLKSARDYNWAVVDVTPMTLRLIVYNSAGSVLDSISLSQQGPATPEAAPVAPTGLTASAAPGKVSLTWQPSAGATSYTVKRATTDKGPFVQVKAGLTVSQFVDESVANGTTYYYVVSAVNAKGESPNCAPVWATPREAAKTVTITSSGVIRLLPTDDAYVNLRQEIDYRQVSFLKFDLGGVKGKIKSATLKLFCSKLQSGTPVPVTVSAVNDDGWKESTITWQTAPKAGAKLVTVGVKAPETVYSFDVTKYIAEQLAGDKIASLRLENLENNRAVSFKSKENANEPETLPCLEIVLE